MTSLPHGNVPLFALDGHGDDDIGAKAGHWTELIRRARLGREFKAAAFVFASYANADGTGIYCGVARFAVDCECSYRTAQRHLDKLRKTGLVELVKRGNSRRGLSDQYRLTFGPDVLDHITVLTPTDYDQQIDHIRHANKAKAERNYHRHTAKPVDNPGSDATLDGVRTDTEPHSSDAIMSGV